MNVFDALKEYDEKLQGHINRLRGDLDVLVRENSELNTLLQTTSTLLSRRTLAIGLLLSELQKTMTVNQIDALTMGNLDIHKGGSVEGPTPIGKLYRRQQGRNFWSNNDDGGLPQGNAACGNDPFVFTVEPSGKLLLARMQRCHFGPMPYGEPRVADTYFVFPEDIEAVS